MRPIGLTCSSVTYSLQAFYCRHMHWQAFTNSLYNPSCSWLNVGLLWMERTEIRYGQRAEKWTDNSHIETNVTVQAIQVSFLIKLGLSNEKKWWSSLIHRTATRCIRPTIFRIFQIYCMQLECTNQFSINVSSRSGTDANQCCQSEWLSISIAIL